jgi:hypothetical protein
MCAVNYRTHLRFSDPWRKHPIFGAWENAAPPQHRNHAEHVEIATKLDGYTEANFESSAWRKRERNRNGIQTLSILCKLGLFNIIVDVLPDLMHMTKGVWHQWLIPMLKGELITRNKAPQKPPAVHKDKGESVKYTDSEMVLRLAAYDEKLNKWRKVDDQLRTWTLTKDKQDEVEQRARACIGEAEFIETKGAALFSGTGSLKAVDWLKISRGLAADYLFKNIIEDNEAADVNAATKRLVGKSFKALLELMQLCLVTTCNVDGEKPTQEVKQTIERLKTRSIRLICLVELQAPATFFAQYMHEMAHVIDSISRWGSARNFWSFFPERFVGWITNFIKARFSPSASLVNGYSRFTFMRRIAPELRAELIEASVANNYKTGDFMKSYNTDHGKGKQGQGLITAAKGWRKCKTYSTHAAIRDCPEYSAVKRLIHGQYTSHGRRPIVALSVMIGGVYINHPKRQWRKGTPCLYKSSSAADACECCGMVTSMLRWQNDVETYYLLCIQPHELISFGSLRSTCKISKAPTQEQPKWIVWTNVTHYCKVVPFKGKPESEQEEFSTLIIVHATSPATEASHYAKVESAASKPI